jgi:hypothetical protein
VFPASSGAQVGYQINGVETLLGIATTAPSWSYVKIPVTAGTVFGFYLYHYLFEGSRTSLLVDNFAVVPPPGPIYLPGIGDHHNINERRVSFISERRLVQLKLPVYSEIDITDSKLSVNQLWSTKNQNVFDFEALISAYTPEPDVVSPDVPTDSYSATVSLTGEAISITPYSPWWAHTLTSITGAGLGAPRPAVSTRGVWQTEALRVFGGPNNTAPMPPEDPVGGPDDLAGDVRLSSEFLYYCYRDFDGINECWVRTPLVTWPIIEG